MLAGGLVALSCLGQESPVFNNNNTVTFSVKVPGADDVEIDGSMMTPRFKFNVGVATIGGKAKRDMRKQGDVWTYTTGTLESDMYTYQIIADDKPVLDPANPLTVRDVADTLNYFILPGGVGDYYLDADVPHGRIGKVWYPSTMPQWNKRRMSIYTPAGYDTARAYPVLYLLHGSGGDENAWQDMGRVAQILDNMLARGEMVPMIVVMPNGNIDLDAAPGEGGDKSVQPSGNNVSSIFGEMEATFVADVVNYVEAHYKTTPRRAIVGVSMGGLHALYIALNNPSMFHYVGLFSAQTANPMSDKRAQGMDKINKIKSGVKDALASLPFIGSGNSSTSQDSSDKYRYVYENTDAKLDSLYAALPQLVYIAVGRDDIVKRLNDDLRTTLTGKNYKFTYNETDGAHTWSNWRKYLLDFLPRLFKE